MPTSINLKIIKKIIFALLFSAVAIFACLSDTKVNAKAADTVTLRNNYALDMTACGDTEKDGVSVIFAEGKTLTFDMLKTIDNGSIGIFTSQTQPTSNLTDTDMKEYAFESGFNYKLAYAGGKVTVSKRGFYEEKYAKVSEVTNCLGGYLGIYLKSEKQVSASCIIDNFEMTGGKKTVTSTFDNNKDQTEKIITGNGFIEKSDKLVYTVSFMTEEGELIAKQKVSIYNYAALPDAPEKEGYYLKGYTSGYENVTDNVICYAVYGKGKAPTPTPEPAKKSGCGATAGAGVSLFAIGFAVLLAKRGKRQ